MKKIQTLLIIALIILFFTKNLFSSNAGNETKQVKETIAKVELGLKRYKIVNDGYPEGNRVASKPDGSYYILMTSYAEGRIM